MIGPSESAASDATDGLLSSQAAESKEFSKFPGEGSRVTESGTSDALDALIAPSKGALEAPALPGKVPLGKVAEHLEKFIKEALKDSDHQPLGVLDESLKELSKLLGSSGEDDDIPTKGLKISYRLGHLSELSSVDRRRSVKALWACALSGSRLSPEMRAVLSRMQNVLAPDEKESLAKWLYNVSKGDAEGENGITAVIGESGRLQARKLLEIVLEGCKTLTELRAVVDGVGKRNLIALRERPISEFVAVRVLGSRMREWRKFSITAPMQARSIKRGGFLKEKAPAPVAQRRLKSIAEELDLRRKALSENGRFARSQAYKSYMAILDKNEQYLRSERRRCKSTKDRVALANLLTATMAVEFKYNLRLTVERDGAGKPKCRWTESWVRDVGAALGGLPEMLIIATPKLRQVRLIEAFKDGSYGQRKSNGLVELSSDAVGAESRDKMAGHVRFARSLITHEVGHSIFYGKAGWGGAKSKENVEELGRKSSPKFDFRGFLEIAGWNVISPDRWKLDQSQELVTVDGEPQRLMRPVRLKGSSSDVILSYQGEDRTLYSFSKPEGLPSSSYGAADPFEDLAEGFVEYRYAPHRLIKIAPWKFLWFEGELGLYEVSSGKDSSVREALSVKLPGLFPPRRDLATKPLAELTLDRVSTSASEIQSLVLPRRDIKALPVSEAQVGHFCWKVFREGGEIEARLTSPMAPPSSREGSSEIITVPNLRLSETQTMTLLLLGLRGASQTIPGDPIPEHSRVLNLLNWVEARKIPWSSPLAANKVELSAHLLEIIGDSEGRAFWDRHLRSTEVLPGIISVRCANSELLASAFCRLQEHYEGPHFHGKVFSLDEYKQWYRKEAKAGVFSYYEDWGGFNVPRAAVLSFLDGEFPNLRVREESLLARATQNKDASYLIGVPEGQEEQETFNHELSHALWATNESYREEAGRIVKALPLESFRRWLIESGYCDQVLDDECAAHLVDEASPFSHLTSARCANVSAKDRKRVREGHLEIEQLFSRYSTGAWERHASI